MCATQTTLAVRATTTRGMHVQTNPLTVPIRAFAMRCPARSDRQTGINPTVLTSSSTAASFSRHHRYILVLHRCPQRQAEGRLRHCEVNGGLGILLQLHSWLHLPGLETKCLPMRAVRRVPLPSLSTSMLRQHPHRHLWGDGQHRHGHGHSPQQCLARR